MTYFIKWYDILMMLSIIGIGVAVVVVALLLTQYIIVKYLQKSEPTVSLQYVNNIPYRVPAEVSLKRLEVADNLYVGGCKLSQTPTGQLSLQAGNGAEVLFNKDGSIQPKNIVTGYISGTNLNTPALYAPGISSVDILNHLTAPMTTSSFSEIYELYAADIHSTNGLSTKEITYQYLQGY